MASKGEENKVHGSKAKEAELRKDVEPIFAKAAEHVKAGDLQAALDLLFKWEKKARLAMIHAVTRDVAVEMLKLCSEANDWTAYCSTLVLISKRRQQHSTVISKSVEAALLLVEKTPDKETKLRFVETLRTVTEGKIFLEVQRARLTRTLAAMKEESGDVAGAASIMQEVQVETYGTMDNAEKVDFILEQIRLCMARRDWVRVQIIQKKIDRKAIDADSMQQLKLRFYTMLCQLYAHEDQTLDLARAHLARLRTKCIQADAPERKKALSAASLFLVLTAYGKDQSNLLSLTQTMEAEKLKELPIWEALLKKFTTQEIITWPLGQEFQAAFASHSVFSDRTLWGEHCDKWAERLRTRVLEHNVRVLARYYSQIRLARLAELIGLEEAEAERLVADMVSARDDDGRDPLYAKIDRPVGIVCFTRPQSAGAKLSHWAGKIGDVLDLVEKTKYLIDRENMVATAARVN